MNFNQRVWNLCKKVPKGRVTTYKEIAHALRTKAYRAVGNALNRNPHAPVVPCHRVVKSDGSVGGYAHGTKRKIGMLKRERVFIHKGKVSNFNRILFKL